MNENKKMEDHDDEPFNVSFDGSNLSQKELTDLAESKAHDFITWMGAENASLNFKQGVRINCKTRGDVWTDLVKCPCRSDENLGQNQLDSQEGRR